jgi:hypothetical protein
MLLVFKRKRDFEIKNLSNTSISDHRLSVKVSLQMMRLLKEDFMAYHGLVFLFRESEENRLEFTYFLPINGRDRVFDPSVNINLHHFTT